jgi:hypothetical protein
MKDCGERTEANKDGSVQADRRQVAGGSAVFGAAILEKLREMGFDGGYSIVKVYVSSRKMDLNEKAKVRFETMPGKQGQMDWGFFGDHLVYEDGKWKKLYCFLMILGYSRMRDNFMVGIKYNSLADLNGQALAWCNKVNGKVHATTSEIPFERLKKEGLNPLSREYIIDKINLRRVQKDCLISYAGNQDSVPAEYIGKDVAVVAFDSILAAYYEGKQIALHRILYQRKNMVVNPQHYWRLTLKQTMDAENVLLKQDKVIDFPLKPSDLSRYDEALYE